MAALRVSSSVLGPVDLALRALSECLEFTVRHHTFNKDSSLFISLREDNLITLQEVGG